MLFPLNFVKFTGNFVWCLQPISKSKIPWLFFIKSLVFCFLFSISQKFPFLPFLKPKWCCLTLWQ